MNIYLHNYDGTKDTLSADEQKIALAMTRLVIAVSPDSPSQCKDSTYVRQFSPGLTKTVR